MEGPSSGHRLSVILPLYFFSADDDVLMLHVPPANLIEICVATHLCGLVVSYSLSSLVRFPDLSLLTEASLRN